MLILVYCYFIIGLSTGSNNLQTKHNEAMADISLLSLHKEKFKDIGYQGPVPGPMKGVKRIWPYDRCEQN